MKKAVAHRQDWHLVIRCVSDERPPVIVPLYYTNLTAFVVLCSGIQSSSPTLKQLLTWERDANIHPRLPKVTDKSGASALLWIHRQLKYQTTIFRNLARVPSEFPTGKDAVAAAYDSVYNEYHGFIVKRIFRTSFDAAPGADEILFHMNRGACEIRRSDSTDSEDLTEGMTTDDDSIVNLKGSDSVSNAASVFRESSSSTMSMNPKNPLEQFSDHIANEWMKLESFMKQCNGAHADSDKSRNALAGPTSSIINLMDLTSIKQRSATATAAEEDISSFIAVIQPFLDGIDKMIDHFNMNDPSKC